MNSELMRHFVEAAEQLNFAHAARSQGVSRATLVASVKELEAELGHPVFDYSAATTTLTPAGIALLETTRIQWAKSAAAAAANVAPPGGKAKASKGKGRAPAVKGASRNGKRRQSR
ncbi:LysR family transcriptional regulator [Subtercola boreus]|uniref:LysR family transcriptional regulator n=1 Tax=Subtercola boreus TaxID=120213 RepID=A0A3E0WE97_9MICO|nr:LysR family transcriptional regulator [Subtercola boreus]RFA23541.1 LysR family transcriptional regulator [Subtercola boreus]RFA23935.1 LysR family transcriptional regulator [Subtercola boreus]RFA29634.1 LysR family transcriptional regulator [Subtercola boreus]